ncbi:YceO family protein [Escherichia coli]|nr:YceO family protein [Escherichia coli]
MRRLLHYLINNIHEHLMLYLFLWGLLAIMDLILCVLFLVFRTDIN